MFVDNCRTEMLLAVTALHHDAALFVLINNFIAELLAAPGTLHEDFLLCHLRICPVECSLSFTPLWFWRPIFINFAL